MLYEVITVEIKGFASDAKKNEKGRLKNFYKEAEADDFINFGLLPESYNFV